MDRREALRKMAIGGATIVAGSAIRSTTAFADGGSRASCRPTAPIGLSVGATTAGSRKDWITFIASVPATPLCPCTGTQAVPEYRWELFTTFAEAALYDTPTGGVQIPPTFSSVLYSSVYVRDVNGTNISAATYTVRLTVRYVCDGPNWACSSYELAVDWITGNGPDGTITNQSGTPIPPDGPSCDSPPPLP